MGSQYYEQPFDNPPTYVESTSRPSRPARPAAGAPPAGGSSSGPAFATSGGWTPPAGSWEPANGHAVAAGAVPPLPPRQNSSVNQVHAHDAQPSTSTSSSNSNGAAYPEEKRSSGLFGGFGRRSKSEKDREREESSSSSDENAQAGGSSFWRGRHQPQAASTSNAASNGKGKGRQPAHRAEEAPSSRFTDSSDAALRAYLSRIPPDAQKALAPLVMTGDAKSIDGTYSVELTATSKWVSAANNAGTHVYPACSLIANARNDIDVTIYLRPNEAQRQQDLLAQQQRPANAPPLPPRRDNSIPLEMLMRAARGRIRFSLPERLPDRPLRIICSGDSHIFAQLPMGFNGKLAIWTPSGQIELSEPLKRNSTIVPSSTGNAQMTVYRILPEGEVENPNVPLRGLVMDLCQLNTTKGRVKVEYAKPLSKAGGDCIVC